MTIPVKTGDDISVFVTVNMTVINFRQMPELGLNAFHGSVGLAVGLQTMTGTQAYDLIQNITLHYITLHYITLHYIGFLR